MNHIFTHISFMHLLTGPIIKPALIQRESQIKSTQPMKSYLKLKESSFLNNVSHPLNPQAYQPLCISTSIILTSLHNKSVRFESSKYPRNFLNCVPIVSHCFAINAASLVSSIATITKGNRTNQQ